MKTATANFCRVDLARHDVVSFCHPEGVDQAAEYVEKNIYSNTDFKGSGDVALVGHSHLDIAYYWRRIHAVHKNARTILLKPSSLWISIQNLNILTLNTPETLKSVTPELFAD